MRCIMSRTGRSVLNRVCVQARLTRQLKEARSEWRAAKEEGKALQAQLDASHKQVLHISQGSPCRPCDNAYGRRAMHAVTKCSNHAESLVAA